MEYFIRYKLYISIGAYTNVAKKLKLQNCFENPWIDYEQGNPADDEDDRIIIRYPNPKYPELTRDIFFDIVCFAYPISHYPEGQLNIEAMAMIDGKEAVRFQDCFMPRIAESYNGTFRYDGEIVAKDLQEKLDEVRRVVNY